ncbi:hypothetical protein SteCoe_11444 [Stentor coeruleus]|uniref:Uncharacterized protein n=1 Tax=Stentor coeruleus TaxID=5963 RepID=A0A1R2CD34_9CILI|nr:hypothetical protein SteCoe_11444 [Stentor coeruleus]
MSRAKSLLKNAQRLGECNTPDLMPEPNNDLLVKLKEYRAQSVCKYASPLKISSGKASLQGPIIPKQNNSFQHISSSRYSRPGTTQFKDNILNYVKNIEKPSHRQNKSLQESYYQERSSDRLYRGARIIIGKTTPEEIFGNLIIDKSEEHLFTESSILNFHEFLSSIRMLYPLRFDLELNWEVVRGEPESSQHTVLGDYFSLEEKMESLLKAESDGMKSINPSQLITLFQEYNRIVRHILLGLKLKHQDNEAIIIEMLWRVIIKLFDNALILHERTIIDLTEMIKTKAKNVIREYSEKLSTTMQLFAKQKEDYEFRIEKLTEQVKTMQTSIYQKDKYIHERDERMNDLLEINNRDKTCIDMSRILKKLNAYISETEDQQLKQVAALSGISHVMSLAEKFDGKPETFCREVQSDWTLPFNPFPEYKIPRLSDNFFYSLYRPYQDVEQSIVLHNLTATLEECMGDELFYMRYGDYLIRNYTSKDEIEEQLREAGVFVLNPDNAKTKLFARLLHFPQKLYGPFELALLRINYFLNSIEGKSSEGYLPLHRLIDTFQLILPSYNQEIEHILSILTYHISFSIDIKKSTFVLLSRFYYAMEKTKKPFKFHLDALDIKKEGISNYYIVPSYLFVEWIKSKLNLWMQDFEINQIVEYFGGEILKIQNVIEKFVAAHLQNCKEIYVCKEEILLLFIESWDDFQYSQIKHCEKIKKLSCFQE